MGLAASPARLTHAENRGKGRDAGFSFCSPSQSKKTPATRCCCMELTVRDTSAIFNIPESTVVRWIKERNLPSREINGDYRFSRAELLEWATVNKVKLAADIFQEPGGNGRHLLFQALTDGGIAHRPGGADKETVLRDIVAGLPLPEGQDRESLFCLLLSREAMGATAVGNGIAIPH